MCEELVFLHFNDVYHVSDVEIIGRFEHLLLNIRASKDLSPPPLTIFSGDAFSPSLESSVLKGEHIAPLLNHLKVDIGCYGNHDFDFGEHRLIELSGMTTFPWVLSNAVGLSSPADLLSSQLLASAHMFIVKDMGSYKVGFFGLAGTDWPSNCQHLPPSRILPPAVVARQLARHLRAVEKCDFVVAITHMRLAEDLEVSSLTESNADEKMVDIILGGHDHEVCCRLKGDTEQDPMIACQGLKNEQVFKEGEAPEMVGNIRIVKSGTDWNGFSVVRLIVGRDESGKAYLQTVKLKQFADIRLLASHDKLPSSHEVTQLLSSVQARISKAVSHPLLHTHVPLDGRSTAIRSRETNLGNMLADAVRAFYATDIAFVNSGGVRCDKVLKAADGVLTVKDIIDIVPFDNAFVVKRIRGSSLLAALENSISDSHTDGRFLQLSGLRLTGNWLNPEGSRVTSATLLQNDKEEPIHREKSYTIAMVSFIASGFDGYTWFKDELTLVGEEGAMTDTSLILQIFRYSPGPPELAENGEVDSTSDAIQRAREAIIAGKNETDGLPIVNPMVEGRILLVKGEVG